MFERERFERDPTNFRRRTLFDHVAIFNGVVLLLLPRLFRHMHWAGRAVSESPRVIGMRVREHDRAGMQALKFSQPIKTAVDHHTRAAVAHQQRCVHAMAACACLDFTARAEKRQLHRDRPGFTVPMVLACGSGGFILWQIA